MNITENDMDMKATTHSDLISYFDAIFAHFQKQIYIGEDISQTEHALQAAYFASQAAPKDGELVLAALFHDIGHMIVDSSLPSTLQWYAPAMPVQEMDGLGICSHEYFGEHFLSQLGFSPRLCHLVGQHVQAKRYLVSTNQHYLKNLSTASLGTLNFQGGVMTEEDIRSFQENPLFRDILQVRTCDEKAKRRNFEVPPFDDYHIMIQENRILS
jgi:predicted HD phosphohydrolase